LPPSLVEFDTVIVRLSGEIGIKGGWTRRAYEHFLMRNMKRTLEHYEVDYDEIVRTQGRLYVKTSVAERASKKLARVFGVSSASPAIETTSKMDDIVAKTLYLAVRVLHKGNSFAVKCRRIGEHPYSSLDVCREVGKRIIEGLPQLDLSVNLRSPDVTINVEIREDRAFVFSEVVEGVGGFPLGSQPKVICLLSGGMDSPVACWLVMKRGCPVVPVYFDNSPFTDETTKRRAVKTAEAVLDWAVGFPKKLYVVPNGANLVEIREKCPEHLTCLLCKRMMYRIAQEIADKEKAEGIVTGEAIGEQASQTLRNLRVLNETAKKYPVHRPLLGFDKKETEELARKIGTYKISIQRAAGCTAAPKKPATRARLEAVLEAEKALDIERMVKRSLNEMQILKLG